MALLKPLHNETGVLRSENGTFGAASHVAVLPGPSFPDYTNIFILDSINGNPTIISTAGDKLSLLNLTQSETLYETLQSNQDVLQTINYNNSLADSLEDTVSSVYDILQNYSTSENEVTVTENLVLNDTFPNKISNNYIENNNTDFDANLQITTPRMNSEIGINGTMENPVEYTNIISVLDNILSYFGYDITSIVIYIDCITGGLFTVIVSGVLMLYNLIVGGSALYMGLPATRGFDITWWMRISEEASLRDGHCHIGRAVLLNREAEVPHTPAGFPDDHWHSTNLL